MTPARNSNVQLLAVLVDWDDEEEGEYRFLVDGQSDLWPVLIPLLPPFPPGEWNEGHVSKDPLSGHPVFSHYTQSDLPEISNTWHHRRIDHLEFKQVHQLRQNIHVVTHPLFDQTLIVKFAEFPWQISYFKAETKAYEWLNCHGIGPKFIAHLTEAGSVFGFVTEYIDGARFADTRDLAACQESLSRLHSVGIKHGDINKYNFLIREGKAMLVDVEASQRCNEKQELEAEYEQLEASLSDTSTKGVPYT
ncbi:hypothetical protein T069G_02751 [Trichoderma breve]|uniref:Alpha-galactosidase A n=1 Tax=Trichoderma breve TaxID=2034170 RepID=A0A9W9BG11_9HYPO|nr:hypothetical protein T069G_02751 [Trichoderma breve]KAJ4861797.1 hypothetical protein T069G_02751 [Trichoderma breve]